MHIHKVQYYVARHLGNIINVVLPKCIANVYDVLVLKCPEVTLPHNTVCICFWQHCWSAQTVRLRCHNITAKVSDGHFSNTDKVARQFGSSI